MKIIVRILLISLSLLLISPLSTASNLSDDVFDMSCKACENCCSTADNTEMIESSNKAKSKKKKSRKAKKSKGRKKSKKTKKTKKINKRKTRKSKSRKKSKLTKKIRKSKKVKKAKRTYKLKKVTRTKAHKKVKKHVSKPKKALRSKKLVRPKKVKVRSRVKIVKSNRKLKPAKIVTVKKKKAILSEENTWLKKQLHGSSISSATLSPMTTYTKDGHFRVVINSLFTVDCELEFNRQSQPSSLSNCQSKSGDSAWKVKEKNISLDCSSTGTSNTCTGDYTLVFSNDEETNEAHKITIAKLK